MPEIARKRFVERVKANDIWVLIKLTAGEIPVVHKLILQSIFICVQSLKPLQRLWRHVVSGKVLLLAVLNQKVSVLVFAIAKVIHADAEIELLVVWLEEIVNVFLDTNWVVPNYFFHVVVWESFSAHHPC